MVVADESTPTSSTIRKYLVIFGCFLMSCACGSMTSFGNFTPYVASYLTFHQWTNLNNGEQQSQQCSRQMSDFYTQNMVHCNTFVSLSIIFQSFACAIGSKLHSLFNARISCLIGGLLITSSYFATYAILIYDSSNDYSLDYTTIVVLVAISFGFLSGTGFGISYMPPIMVGIQWYPENQSLVVSIISLGLTTSPFIYNYIQTWYINPQNRLPLETENGQFYCGFTFETALLQNTVNCFLELAVIILVVTVVGVLLIKDNATYVEAHSQSQLEYKKEALAERKMNKNKTATDSTAIKSTAVATNYMATDNSTGTSKKRALPKLRSQRSLRSISSPRVKIVSNFDDDDTDDDAQIDDQRIDLTTREAFSTLQFWQLFLAAGMNILCYTFVYAEWKVMGQEYIGIKNDELLTSVGSISILLAAFAQIGWGIYMDYCKSFRKTMGVMMGICVVCFSTMALCKNVVVSYDEFAGAMMYGVWLLALHSCLVACYTILPLTCNDTFGETNAEMILSFIYAAEVMASVAQIVLFGFLNSEWIVICELMAGFTLISMISAIKFDTHQLTYICNNSKSADVDIPMKK